MGGLTLSRIVLALLGVFILLASSVFHVAAVAYVPGVKAGDYVKYTVGVSIYGPRIAPQYIKDLLNTSYFMLEIRSVQNDNVTASVIQGFNNGTSDRSTTIEFSLQSGKGNQSRVPALSMPAPVLSAGLQEGNPLYDPSTLPSNDLKINKTEVFLSAGVQRLENGIWLWQSFSNGGWRQSVLGFDEHTGVATSIFSDEYNGSINALTLSHTESRYTIAATETNLWYPTILGLPLVVFYGMIGGIIAAVAIVGVLLLRRRSRRLSEQETDQWNLPRSLVSTLPYPLF